MGPFHNTYIHLPESFYKKVMPASFPTAQIFAFNESLAKDLGLGSLLDKDPIELSQIFSGQQLLEGSEPLAMAYAGFQFGHPVAQLGDGRAHLLGEAAGFDIQLKGSGPTPFSRRGDGKSALGPVIREYLVSEAMHALGVPTTRALAAVSTGETILRQFGEEPGGIFTRVAASHIRVGTFQYFGFKEDTESLKTLLDYTLSRHYPELLKIDNYSDKALELLKELTKKQAELIAKWYGLGFIHGVMNTDNFSLAGITIDYGPCAFMDEFKWNKVFSSIDQQGRYAYSNQISIAQWNILRLADCLLPLIESEQELAITKVEKGLISLFGLFEQRKNEVFAQKLGIKNYQEGDQTLIQHFLDCLEKNSLDFTLSFSHLHELHKGNFSQYDESRDIKDFVSHWKKRVPQLDDLTAINPTVIPRNHLIQQVIDHAYEGDFTSFKEALALVTKPFNKPKNQKYILPPKREERVYKTYCGT